MGTVIGDNIGTTVGIRFPHSLLRTRQFKITCSPKTLAS